jgi:hypothetical protein
MGGVRKFAALVLALACAAVLPACGGGSSSTSSTSATAPPSTTEAESGGGANESSQKNEKAEGGAEKQQEEGSESGSEEGEVSPNDRSAQFRTKGGDNSIQNYGEEEGAAERAAATTTITVFFSASKHKEWARVCGVLSQKARAQMEEFAKRVPKLKGKTCAGVIELIYSSSPSNAGRPETIKGGVVALRRKGGQSFALYHGMNGKPYAFPLVREGGEWKLIGMAPTPLSF